MKGVKQWLVRLDARYGEFTMRERVLVGLGLLGSTWMLWQLTIGDLVASHQVDVARSVTQLEAQRTSATSEQQSLRIARKADPNDALRAEQAALKSLLAELDQTLAGSLSRFVAPERMPAMLQDVLGAHPGLKLKLVKRLPSRALLPAVAANAGDVLEASASSPEQQPNLYLHPLRVEFEGRYFDVLAYLQSLEQSPWRFNWRLLDFATETYPEGRAVIEIETLSRDQRWLGV